MYLEYYGFRSKPFDLFPDPRFLYVSKEHDLALAHLEYGIMDGKAFIALTGEAGTGKTTLIRYLLKKIENRVNAALIVQTNLDPTSFLEMILTQFGQKPESARKSALYEHLRYFLERQNAMGRRSILILDEAQNMPGETLEEMRMLSNLQSEDSALLQIILVGQPELKRRLDSPDMAQLAQRIAVFYNLAPLPEREVGRYITHRLAVGGHSAPENLFTPEAAWVIARFSNGVPRLINTLCDAALMYGYAEDAGVVDLNLMKKVLRDRGVDDMELARFVPDTRRPESAVGVPRSAEGLPVSRPGQVVSRVGTRPPAPGDSPTAGAEEPWEGRELGKALSEMGRIVERLIAAHGQRPVPADLQTQRSHPQAGRKPDETGAQYSRLRERLARAVGQYQSLYDAYRKTRSRARTLSTHYVRLWQRHQALEKKHAALVSEYNKAAETRKALETRLRSLADHSRELLVRYRELKVRAKRKPTGDSTGP